MQPKNKVKIPELDSDQIKSMISVALKLLETLEILKNQCQCATCKACTDYRSTVDKSINILSFVISAQAKNIQNLEILLEDAISCLENIQNSTKKPEILN